MYNFLSFVRTIVVCTIIVALFRQKLHYFGKGYLFRLILNYAKFCIFSVFSLAIGKTFLHLCHQ